MELHQAVTALAAFVGSYLGQRHAAAAYAPQLVELKARLAELEERVGWLERYRARVSRLLARGAP